MKNFLRNAQEESPVLLFGLHTVIFFASYFDNVVSSQVENKLVLPKIRMSWKLQKWRYAFCIEEDGSTVGNEIHFLQLLAIGDYHFTWLKDSAVHVNDQLILKTQFSVDEKVAKLSFESFKK